MDCLKLHMVGLCITCSIYCAVLEPKPQQIQLHLVSCRLVLLQSCFFIYDIIRYSHTKRLHTIVSFPRLRFFLTVPPRVVPHPTHLLRMFALALRDCKITLCYELFVFRIRLNESERIVD